MACTRHDTFFISHTCRHACARKIDDVETLVQSTRVHTRCVAEARVHVRYVHAKSVLRVPLACRVSFRILAKGGQKEV